MPCASGEAVLAMGMLPRLVRQWVAAAAEGSAEAWACERRAERLKTLLDLLVGALRGSIIFVMAALTLSGQNVNAAFGGVHPGDRHGGQPLPGPRHAPARPDRGDGRLAAPARDDAGDGGDPGGHRLPAARRCG